MKNGESSLANLIPRHAKSLVQRAMSESRVVVLNGPRQSGKTTLVREQIQPILGGRFATLDDDRQLAAFRSDPASFIEGTRPVLIDDFQRGGEELLRAVKLAVDREQAAGQFVLAGSTRFLTVPNISKSLAGRAYIVDLWPLLQGEAAGLGDDSDSLVLRIFDKSPLTRDLDPRAFPARSEYFDRICRGGFPAAQGFRGSARRRFFANYVRMITRRDVPDVSRIHHVEELPRLLRAIAVHTSQELNATRLAENLNVERATVSASYLPLMGTVYLTLDVPAWARGFATRVARKPKVYVVDTGLAANLLRVDAQRLAEPTSVARGPLVETFVVNEIRRQIDRFEDELGAELSHYRSHTGAEIDVVIETADGRIAGVEIKASSTVRATDFRHLASVRNRIDDLSDCEFRRGIVFYTGDEALSFGDRLEALPIASLWLPPA